MKKMLPRLILILGAALLSTCTMATPPPPGDFNVTEQGGVYAVNGVARAQLNLTRGTTYTFSVNAPGHPFYLTTNATGGSGLVDPVTVGVTGAPVDVGILTFTPDAAQALPIYYQCTVHPNMGNDIDLAP